MIGTSWTQNKTRHVQLGWISLLHEHVEQTAVCRSLPLRSDPSIPSAKSQDFGGAIGHSCGSRSEHQALSRRRGHEHPLASRGLS